jgi:hypothetical protein
MSTRIAKGTTVRIMPQWRDPGDENVRFVALEDEDGGRVLIGALGVLSHFIPSQVVRTDMLEVTPCES